MILPVATIVTEKSFTEFLLLKQTIENYHACEWYISCDNFAKKELEKLYKNINCFELIKSSDADHNIGSSIQKENFMKIMLTKFDITRIALAKENSILYMDCDMVFVNPIEEKIISLFENKNIDAFICQHMTNDWQNEAAHGLFNAGMFHVKNINFINEWENLSKNYKKYNFYYEQQPLEYVQRNFVTLNLPINYNIGWWRFNRPSTQNRLELLNVKDDKIFFGKNPAVNFHVHALKDFSYQNFGQFLIDKICNLIENTNNQNYKKILEKIK